MLLLGLVFGVGLLVDSPIEPGAIVYAIPVVLIAIAFGPAAGAATGAGGGALFWLASAHQNEMLDSIEIGYRIAVLVFLGAVAGVLATRLESSEQNRIRSLRLAEQNAERLEEAQRIAHLGSWEWDVPANSIHWSVELYRIFGVDPEGFDASYESYLMFLHPRIASASMRPSGRRSRT